MGEMFCQKKRILSDAADYGVATSVRQHPMFRSDPEYTEGLLYYPGLPAAGPGDLRDGDHGETRQ